MNVGQGVQPQPVKAALALASLRDAGGAASKP